MAHHSMDGCEDDRSGARGFSILELVVVLAVLTAVVAMIAPALAGMTQRSSDTTTRQQEKTVYAAIFGEPSRGTFGFIGDVGRLPASITELASGGSLPAFHTSDGATAHVGNVGYGWNGPYVSGVISDADLQTDPWGQAFSYSASGANAGRVISAGPDGTIGTADDIAFPAYAPPATGTLFVTVKANGIANPFGAAVKVYYPLDGEEVVTPTQKFDPQEPNASFDGFAFDVTPGIRVIVVSHTGHGGGGGGGGCSTVSRTVPVKVVAGRTNVLEIALSTTAQVMLMGNYTCTIPD